MILKFDLIICTYKRPKILLKNLQSVLLNNVRPNKIIIIDQNLDYFTENTVRNFFIKSNYKNFIYIKNIYKKGLTQSKNIGIKHCTSYYVFFLDDDIKIDKFFFENSLSTFSRVKCDGVCGVIINYKQSFLKNLFFFIFNHYEFRDNRYHFINYKKFLSKNILEKKVYHLPGGITGYKREIFNKIKFDEKNITHNFEDVDFCFRLKKILNREKFYISYQSKAEDLINPNLKANIEKRVFFMRIFCLKHRSLKISFLFFLSFLGVVLLTLVKFDFLKSIKIILVLLRAKYQRL